MTNTPSKHVPYGPRFFPLNLSVVRTVPKAGVSPAYGCVCALSEEGKKDRAAFSTQLTEIEIHIDYIYFFQKMPKIVYLKKLGRLGNIA